MAEPIRISIFFETNGRAALQRGAADVERLNTQIARLSGTAGGLPRALRLAENNLNQFGNAAYTQGLTGVSFLSEQFVSLYGVLSQFAQLGFAGLIASTGLAVYGIRELGREFFKVNEAFANLEISVGSAFKSSTIGRDLRNQLREITVTSPVPFKGLADATRAVSYIPQLSNQIGRQAANGTLGDEKGFFRQYIQLVEQLMVFRPDKAVTDATFAIREAATGELRSLIRRFDFPAQLLVTASGKSIDDLKRDPVAMVGAIKKSLDKIITPQAIRQIAFQPTRLFDNILEQIKDIPLLEIGDAGLYDKILGFFERLFNGASIFVKQKFPEYAKRFSSTLGSIFDTFVSSSDQISERFMGMFNLDASSLPALSKFERIIIGIESALNKVNEALPSVLDRTSKLLSQIIPAFIKIMGAVVSVIDYISEKFNKSPILTTVGLYLTTQLTSIFRAGTKIFYEGFIENLKRERGNAVLPTLNRANQQFGGLAGGAGAAGAAGAAGGLNYPFRFPPQPVPGTFNPFLGAAGTRGSGAILSQQQQQLIASNARTYASNVAILRQNGFRQVGNTTNFVSTAVGGLPITVSALGNQVSRNTTLFGGPTLGAQGLRPVTGPGYTSPATLAAPIQRFQQSLAQMNLALNQAGITAVQTGQVLQRGHLYNVNTGRAVSQNAFQQANAAYSANPINLRPPLTPPLNPGYRLPPARITPLTLNAYNQYMDAQRNGPNLTSRLAGRAGAEVLAGGASARVAGIASSAVLTTGALVATVTPVLAVLAASAVFGFLLDKASDYLDNRATRVGREARDKAGFSDETFKRVSREGQEANNFLAKLNDFQARNGELKNILPQTATLQLPVIQQLQTRKATEFESSADVRPVPKSIEGAPISSAVGQRAVRRENRIEAARSASADSVAFISNLIRTSDNYTYSVEQQAVSFDKFQVGVANLTADYQTLNDALAKGPTLFSGIRAENLKLLSAPNLDITSYKQLEEVAYQIARAMNQAQQEVRKLSEASKGKIGIELEQIFTEPQQAIFSRLKDLEATFIGSKNDRGEAVGPQGYITALQNERSLSGAPSRVSSLVSRLGPLRESQEVAKIIENSQTILGNITEQVNPFRFLEKNFAEENLRLEEIQKLRLEALSLSPNDIGKDTAAQLKGVLKQARTAGIRIGPDSLKKYEEVISQLESGANFNLNVEAFKALIDQADEALYSGVESRMGALLAQFVQQVPKLTEAGSNAELSVTKQNLAQLVTNVFDQVRERVTLLSDKGSGVDADVLKRLNDAVSGKDFSTVLGKFEAPAANAEALSGDYQAANARLQMQLVATVGSAIDEIEKISKGATGFQTVRDKFADVKKYIDAKSGAVLELYSEGIKRAIDQYNRSLSDTISNQSISIGNVADQRFAQSAIQSFETSSERTNLKLGPVRQDFKDAQVLPNVGEFNFTNALDQNITAISQFEDDLKSLESQLTIVNGVVDRSKVVTQQQTQAAIKYDSLLQLITSRQRQYNELLFNQVQAQSFNQLTTQETNPVTNFAGNALFNIQRERAQVFAQETGAELPRENILSQIETPATQFAVRLSKLREQASVALRNAQLFDTRSRDVGLPAETQQTYRELSLAQLAAADAFKKAEQGLLGFNDALLATKEQLATAFVQPISIGNAFDVRYARQAGKAFAEDPKRERFNLPTVPGLQEALIRPNQGEFGFENRLEQTTLLVRQYNQDTTRLFRDVFSTATKTIDSFGNQTFAIDDTTEAYKMYLEAVQNASQVQRSFTEVMSNSVQTQAFTSLTTQARAINNEYDVLLAKRQQLLSDQFVTASRGSVVSPNAQITSLPELGRDQTQNRLLKYRELEITARRNYELTSAAASEALAAKNVDEYNRLVALSDQALQTASSFRTLQEEIQGRGGLFSSFAEGAGELVSAWRAAATNFKEIGRSITESFSSSFSSAFASFAVGAQSAKEAMRDFARSFLQTAIQLFAQKAVQSLLGMVFGGAGGIAGIATSAISGGVGSAGGGIGALSGGAAGAQIGGRFTGGLIPGISPGRDNVLSYLESGEFIIPSKAVRKFGSNHFEAYRKGQLPDAVTKNVSSISTDRRFMPVTEDDKKKIKVRSAFMTGGAVGAVLPPSQPAAMRLGGAVSEIQAFYNGGKVEEITQMRMGGPVQEIQAYYEGGSVAKTSTFKSVNSYYMGGMVEGYEEGGEVTKVTNNVSAKEPSKIRPIISNNNSTNSISISVPMTMNIQSGGGKGESDAAAIAKAGEAIQKSVAATVDEKIALALRQGGSIRNYRRS